MSTDYVIAREIAAAAVGGRDDPPAVLLPALAYTKSDEHHAFPGSLWLSWDTLMATLVDLGRSLAASEISRCCSSTGTAATRRWGRWPTRELRRRFGLRTFFTHPGVPVDQGGTSSAPSEFGMGVHGGHGETSLMLHLRPDLVRMELARPNVPTALREYRHIGFGKPVSFGWTSDDFGPDGHIGDPTGATAEQGSVSSNPRCRTWPR